MRRGGRYERDPATGKVVRVEGTEERPTKAAPTPKPKPAKAGGKE